MTPPVELNRTQAQLAVAGLVLLAFATYFNAMSNGLVWDDPIVLGRQLRVFESVGAVFFPPRDIPQYSPDYYRPITTLSYLIDRAIGGSGPFPFHFSVVLYHIAATVLVFHFGRLVLGTMAGGSLGALIGAALFAVHPIHSESVAWGAGRSDVIACALALAGAVVYGSDRQKRLWRSILSAGLVLLGAMAKETAVIVLLLVPASDLFLTRASAAKPAASRAERRRSTAATRERSVALMYVPFAIALVVYLVLRQAALESMVGASTPLTPAALTNVVGAVGFYLSKVVVPVNQCAYISDLPVHPLQLLASLLGLVAIATGLWMTWQRRSPLAFLILWTMSTLAPSLAIVVKIPSAPVAERYLYIPSVGVCLLCGAAVAWLFTTSTTNRRRFVIAGGAAMLVAAGAAAAVRRNAVWRSNISLWQDAAEKNTTDALPLRSLAAAHLEEGDADVAEKLFHDALQRRNNAVGQQTIYNNLGSMAMQRKRYDDAEGYYRKAIEFNRTADGLYNLGLIPLTRAMENDDARSVEWKQAQARQARDLLLQAAKLNPHDPDTEVAIGQAAQAAGDTREARIHYQRALDMGLAPPTAAAVRKLLEGLS